jgi:hypothetical protein
VQTLLQSPLRLRTACDLEVRSVDVRRPDGWALPTADALAGEIERAKVDFGSPIPHAMLSE